MDRLVHALKYQGQLAVGRVLGSLLGGAAVDRGLQFEVDAILPVPLHPRRHAERTFNQSAEIGRRAARLAGRPFLEGAMARVRDTRPQVGLGLDERRSNLADAFECRADLCGQRVAVVDDVMTTGSTARSMARVLQFAGVASVRFWCIAHVARSDEVDSAMHEASRDT